VAKDGKDTLGHEYGIYARALTVKKNIERRWLQTPQGRIKSVKYLKVRKVLG